MATVTPTEISHPLSHRGLRIYKWASVNAADDCETVVAGSYTDKTVYFISAVPFGGNMSLVGSPLPTGSGTQHFITLTDPQGNAISGKSSATAEAVLEHAYLIKPVAGSGVANVDVFLVLGSTK